MTTFSYSYDFKIKALDLSQQFQPIIYGWWRNHTYLYIGMSRRGLQRLRSHSFSYLILSSPTLTLPITDSILSRLIPTFKPHEWNLC